MFIRKFSKKEKCPICGHENTSIRWFEDHSDENDFCLDEVTQNISPQNSYYLCHLCGYFIRVFEQGPAIYGITLDPRKIPLGRQLQTLRKYRRKVDGYRILDHRKYKFKEE